MRNTEGVEDDHISISDNEEEDDDIEIDQAGNDEINGEIVIPMIDVEDNSGYVNKNESSSVMMLQEEDDIVENAPIISRRPNETEEEARARKFKHLEREANLRIGYGTYHDDDEDEEEKVSVNKKKPSLVKANNHQKKGVSNSHIHGSGGGDGKLKQTRLIFTKGGGSPDSSENHSTLIGKKRAPESPLDEEEE